MTFVISQIGTQSFSSGGGGTIALSGAVTAGDFLYLLFVGNNFGATASIVSAVSDNVNGPWTILDNSGDYVPDGNHHIATCFAYLANSAAASGGLTVTATAPDSGGANMSIVIDLQGAATGPPIIAHGYTTLSSPSSPQSTTAETDTRTNDWVIGYIGQYGGSITYTAGAGAILDETFTNSSGSSGAFLHQASINGSNQVSIDGAGSLAAIAGTVIVSTLTSTLTSSQTGGVSFSGGHKKLTRKNLLA